ncbi:hypothetical protein HJFPF1_08800 [Paramyrothecium foliicola]|nr:hypothetical protein HJFPF1_08800 [Paramyrothecium foliicola]
MQADVSTASAASLPYHEPGILTIIIQASLLLLLNLINFALDKVAYCGLLGQVLLGVAWGTPGAKWLDANTETVIVNLGYLGLLLLVYEGMWTVDLSSIAEGEPPAVILVNATPLQCFAAGAALCATSLGTTFTVLGTSGLSSSRLGVVLSSAAMMDDVVGLVMVQIISNLGGSATTISATTVVRPLMVAIAFAVCAPLVCLFVVRPVTLWLNTKRAAQPRAFFARLLVKQEFVFLLHTAILLGCIIGANYAGTSSLFAAYVAGASISWWDSEVVHPGKGSVQPPEAAEPSNNDDPASAGRALTGEAAIQESHTLIAKTPSFSGSEIYHRYYQQPVDCILKPFFFASIGFSIPITQMFAGEIVWKGIIYTLLMALGKLICGVWLLKIPMSNFWPQRPRLPMLRKLRFNHAWGRQAKAASATATPRAQEPSTSTELSSVPPTNSVTPEAQPNTQPSAASSPSGPHTSPPGTNPTSLYPATILGCAMTARGEIGFLISSVAESNGIFASESDQRSSSDIFLVVTWAIVLCTILGPLAVGLLVRRVKKLEAGVRTKGGVIRKDVLGAWGVE